LVTLGLLDGTVLVVRDVPRQGPCVPQRSKCFVKFAHYFVILAVTVPGVLTWSLFFEVHLDSQTIYGGMLGALLGIGLDRLVSGFIGNK
jgi:hypothetical protein